MKTVRTFNCFRAGTHRAMSGEEIAFSQADLAAAVAAYSPELFAAPLVPGHPVDDSPRLGEVLGFSLAGDKVFATAEVADGLVNRVRAKRVRGVSVKWFRPTDNRNPKPGVWYPRHVGFLEAQNPAVKGLDPVEFAEDALGFHGVSVASLEAALFSPAEVMFAEATTKDPMDDRATLDKAARMVIERHPGWTYARAVQFVGDWVRAYREKSAAAQAGDRRSVAFQEALLSYRAAHPAASQLEAAQYLRQVLRQ